MEVILLEQVGRLGKIGDVVNVRPGFARNFLIPQHKALRANELNKAEFEKRKEEIAAQNDKTRAAAQKIAKKLEGFTLSIVRQASEDGKLYGSVTARDVAEELVKAGHSIERKMVALPAMIKNTGTTSVPLQLHPELRVNITLTVVRNEADIIDTQDAAALLEEPAEDAPDAEISQEG